MSFFVATNDQPFGSGDLLRSYPLWSCLLQSHDDRSRSYPLVPSAKMITIMTTKAKAMTTVTEHDHHPWCFKHGNHDHHPSRGIKG